MRSMVEGWIMRDGSAPKPKPLTIKRARKLRREMTLPEVLLWQALRSRPGGFKFRRQHPSGPYILDFFCAEAGLAIEIDGEAHNVLPRIEHDHARDAWLDAAGVKTLRFPARDVLEDLEPVLSAILHEARGRLPLHHAAHGPPPQVSLGED